MSDQRFECLYVPILDIEPSHPLVHRCSTGTAAGTTSLAKLQESAVRIRVPQPIFFTYSTATFPSSSPWAVWRDTSEYAGYHSPFFVSDSLSAQFIQTMVSRTRPFSKQLSPSWSLTPLQLAVVYSRYHTCTYPLTIKCTTFL